MADVQTPQPATDIDELFNRNPRQYTKDCIPLIIAELRLQRKNWAEAGKPAKAAKTKVEKLDIRDLGL